MTEPLPEGRALEWWCRYLDQLRHHAQQDGWAHLLEQQQKCVRDGASALEAAATLQLEIPTEDTTFSVTRGHEPGLPQTSVAPASLPALDGLDPVTSTGRGTFGCPIDRCTRTDSRDDMGHRPACHFMDGMPMKPRPRGS